MIYYNTVSELIQTLASFT